MAYLPTSIQVYPVDQGRLERPMQAEAFFRMLEVVTALILLAACFNIGNLLLSKAVLRRAEMATRVALGATRARLIRQLLLESTLIGGAGCGVGIALSVALTHVLATMTPVYMDPSPFGERLTTEAAVDFRIVGVALVLAAAATLIFGLVPALLASRADPGEDLRRSRPRWTRRGVGLNARQTVLVGQVAFSVVLAASAGLYVRSFLRAAAVESEYSNKDSILLARVAPSPMSRDRNVTFYESLLRSLNADARVVSATTGMFTPYFMSTIPTRLPDDENPDYIPNRSVAPRWFEAHGVPLLAGREFDGSPFDMENALIINQQLADRLWPDGEGLNRIVNSGNQDRIVIGIADMARCESLLGEPAPCSWRPFAFLGSSWLRIQTLGPPEEFVAPLREMVRALEPEVAVSRETTLSSWISALTARQRAAATLSAGLAGLAVLLMVVGTISLFLSMVRENARETAIRQALGASPMSLILLVVGRGAGLMALGVIAGLVGAYAVSSRISDQLYRTAPGDPVVLALVAVLVLLPGLLALYWCARRSVRADPAAVLQAE
jgi:predicted permease